MTHTNSVSKMVFDSDSLSSSELQPRTQHLSGMVQRSSGPQTRKEQLAAKGSTYLVEQGEGHHQQVECRQPQEQPGALDCPTTRSVPCHQHGTLPEEQQGYGQVASMQQIPLLDAQAGNTHLQS